MSFANLFNGGAARRGSVSAATSSSGKRSAKNEAIEETVERIGSRLDRFTAPASDGLESAFVPEELGTMFADSKLVPFEESEGRPRPL